MTMHVSDPEPLAHAPTEEQRRAQERRLLDAWRTPTGWRYWSAVNNSAVGLWYTAGTFMFLAFGGVLALMMRLQLAGPDNDCLTAERASALTPHASQRRDSTAPSQPVP